MKKVFNEVLDLIYPENIYCSCCGDMISKDRIHGLCDKCIKNLDWIKENPFDSKEGFSFHEVLSLVYYDYYAQKIVHDLKFHQKSYMAKGIGSLMGELLLSNLGAGLILVPVPMYKEKMKARGYNQAELLAMYAARSSDSIYMADVLLKIKETKSMRMARQEGRRNALDGSMIINDKRVSDIQGKEIVLVDDVITTGATAEYCSQILLKAGTKSVTILSFAAGKFKGKQ